MGWKRFLELVRFVCVACVAAPAAGLTFLLVREFLTEPGGVALNLNSVFHLLLAFALLVLAADFSTAILRSERLEMILLTALGSFLAVVAGFGLSELLGPPVLLLLLIACTGWAAQLVRSARQERIGFSA
ncbi:MAG: hypothetical protein RQ731_06210 [Anaerosomatales bacterium]|nr:hypothetical protein [Anaerosomatales bacterium]MDT8434332.1 hypothetical protein [Anaerosomatales bacterium]